MASPVSQEIVFDVTFPMLTNTSLLLDGLRAFIEEQNLNFTEMDPDIYIANGYKWFYSLRGLGLLHVKKDIQDMIYPVVISTTNSLTASFESRFRWLGCKDYVPWITMKNALEFREMIGDKEIIEYIHNMAIQGGKRVAEMWWGEGHENGKLYIDDEDYIGCLVNILMPPNNLTSWSNTFARLYNIWIRVDNDVYGDVVARFSTQIFHQLDDFEQAAYTVLDIIQNAST